VKIKFWVTGYSRQEIERFLEDKDIAYSTYGTLVPAYMIEEEDAIILKIQFPFLWRVNA
jgi:hypothetical protein